MVCISMPGVEAGNQRAGSSVHAWEGWAGLLGERAGWGRQLTSTLAHTVYVCTYRHGRKKQALASTFWVWAFPWHHASQQQTTPRPPPAAPFINDRARVSPELPAETAGQARRPVTFHGSSDVRTEYFHSAHPPFNGPGSKSSAGTGQGPGARPRLHVAHARGPFHVSLGNN